MMLTYAQHILKPETSEAINALPQSVQAIADRWALGWAKEVKALEASGQLIAALQAQAEKEREAYLAATESGQWAHLARHEVMQMLEIDPAPPAL